MIAAARPHPPAAAQQTGGDAWSQSSSGSSYRSSASIGSNYVATASDMRYSDITWSETRRSETRTSEVRESDFRASEMRASELRPSAARWSEVRESELRESDPRWSEMRTSASTSTWQFEGTGDLADARSAVRPPEPEAADTSAWERTRTEVGDVHQALPPVYVTIHVGGEAFYYFDHVFYKKTYQNSKVVFEVIAPPMGATVQRLPPDCELEDRAGDSLAVCEDGTVYQESVGGWVVVDRRPVEPEPEPEPTPTEPDSEPLE